MAQAYPIIFDNVDSETSTVCTSPTICTTSPICTPPTTNSNPITSKDQQKWESFQSSIPWPGRTFIIRSHDTGQVITFLDGEIILDKPGGFGTFRWRCVERRGWLGFRDPVSARYMGYDSRGWIRCAVDKHNDWEYICVRKRPEGGYVLLVLVENKLLPMGVCSQETGGVVRQRVKIRDWNSEGIVWDFIEVPCPTV
ncbi:hypothetical protein COCVIDRAFT_97711 [Bipolaris victoriae FI3]|uniref:Uncharacterized protein n=1 Tax=Bipolaris victoriae (strain FI3) TaxID=930091 RepID=W7EHF3_BIPV3|nr:hypothetical protein COCVIDRAFT_97711 [Bipolaris victoriae FI3]